MVIPCLKLRDKIAEKIKLDVENLKSRGVSPTFAIIQIGENPPSDAYIRVKTKKAEELGIKTQLYNFQAQSSNFQKEVEELISKLNKEPSIHGIIIQRPLPTNIDETHLQSLISLKKDIDGLSEKSPFKNPLVAAVEHVIRYVLSNYKIYNLSPKTYNLVVVGKGITAGGPIFEYFSNHPKIHLRTTDYVLRTQQIDSKTPNPNQIIKSADIIISCVGKEKIIRTDNIKKDVILISVGQHQSEISNFQFPISKKFKNLKLKIKNLDSVEQKKVWKGDYDENEINSIASAYTPTPGGIGPLNVIFLLQNVVSSSQNV